jgi:DNA topoisomerase IA
MKIAEKLYLKGNITYPRTESTHYSENFNFKSILEKLKSNSAFTSHITDLLEVIPPTLSLHTIPRQDSNSQRRELMQETIHLSLLSLLHLALP